MDDDWQPVTRAGKELPRYEETPCIRCPKIPPEIRKDPTKKPGPEHAVHLNEKCHQAYMYYLEVKAGATMHNDPFTRRICALIRNVEDQVEREQYERMDSLPIALALMELKR